MLVAYVPFGFYLRCSRAQCRWLLHRQYGQAAFIKLVLPQRATEVATAVIILASDHANAAMIAGADHKARCIATAFISN